MSEEMLELKARRAADWDPDMRNAPPISSAGEAAAWGGGYVSLATAMPMPMPAPAGLDDLRIDEGDRPALSFRCRDGERFRTWLIVGALAGSCSLAWIVVQAPPLGLAWPGVSSGSHLLPPDPASSMVRDQKPLSSADGLDSKKEDRLHTPGELVREHEREVAARKPSSAKLSSSTMSRGAAQQRTRIVKRETTDSEPRILTPAPETKPTTIEGWTVREVTNGVAVLEGPHGIWRVTRGETVPGLGRVDSIVLWGHRWIVATSKGLVSTP